MMYVLEKEEADMLIDNIITNPEFESIILEKLHRSRNYFESKTNMTELNEIYYRLGRFYKKLYDIRKETDYLNKSISYYSLCEDSARASNHFRMEQFAYGHKLILTAQYVDPAQKSNTIVEIDKVIKRLTPYSNDVWSARMIRNFRWRQTVFLKDLGENDRYLKALIENFKFATMPPLHSHGVTDLRASAMILSEIIRYHETNHLPAGLSEFYHENIDIIKNWFNDPDFNYFKTEEFNKYLNTLITKPN
jgi:hypothetical protein